MKLPEELREMVERRLIEQGFRNYKGLAQWIRQQGHEISVNSLQRYGRSLAQDLETTRIATAGPRVRAEALPSGSGATAEGLIQLAQEKLCTALVEIDQFKHGDMSRLAHAVAHLTQAAISLQRWTNELNRRTEERKSADPQAKSKPGGGLSPETSRALRHALLGIAPFNPEQVGSQKAADHTKASAPPATAVSHQFEKGESHQTEPAAPLKKRAGSDDSRTE